MEGGKKKEERKMGRRKNGGLESEGSGDVRKHVLEKKTVVSFYHIAFYFIMLLHVRSPSQPTRKVTSNMTSAS